MKVISKLFRVISKILFGLLLISPAFVFQFAAHTKAVQDFSSVVQLHLPLYLIALLLIKAVSIVYPPLPGAAFTLGSLPLIGWQLAYVVDVLGSFLGATLAFYLGKKYGYTLLNHILGKTLTDKIATIKLKPQNQVEASICLRLAVGGMLSDGLAWGASLIGFRYLPFIIGYLLSHTIVTLPIFYFIAAAISFNSWLILGTIMILAWLVIYLFKGRYFE